MYTVGQIIRKLRKAKGLTLSELADTIEGYDAGNLSRFENDKQDIATEKLEAIAKSLGTTLAYIYGLKENKIENSVNQEIKPYETNISVTQFNIKDFNQYTDKLSKTQILKLEELISYFVVMSEKHQNHILDLVTDMYDLTSRINAISRRRKAPDNLIGRLKDDSASQPREINPTKLQK